MAVDAQTIATIVASVGGGTAIFSFLAPLANKWIDRQFKSGDREEDARVRLIESQQRLVERVAIDQAQIMAHFGLNSATAGIVVASPETGQRASVPSVHYPAPPKDSQP